jgi:hypothetical protein
VGRYAIAVVTGRLETPGGPRRRSDEFCSSLKVMALRIGLVYRPICDERRIMDRAAAFSFAIRENRVRRWRTFCTAVSGRRKWRCGGPKRPSMAEADCGYLLE